MPAWSAFGYQSSVRVTLSRPSEESALPDDPPQPTSATRPASRENARKRRRTDFRGSRLKRCTRPCIFHSLPVGLPTSGSKRLGNRRLSAAPISGKLRRVCICAQHIIKLYRVLRSTGRRGAGQERRGGRARLP